MSSLKTWIQSKPKPFGFARRTFVNPETRRQIRILSNPERGYTTMTLSLWVSTFGEPEDNV